MIRGLSFLLALSGVAGCGNTILQDSCGPGTVRQGEVCLGVDAGAGSVRCGAGTVEVSGTCILVGTDGGTPHDAAVASMGDAGPSLVCGPGTHESAGECVPDADPGLGYFDVRVPGNTFNADGFSDIPVFVIGRDASGAPYTGDVVLTLSRATAGNLQDATPTLTTVGGTTYFTPCRATDAGCLGAFEITLALPTAPSSVLATSGPLMLVASSDVGSLAPCAGGGNVIYFDGDTGDYIEPGRHTIRLGTWNIQGTPSGAVDTVTIHVDPSDRANGLWWDLDFSSLHTGTPLAEIVYENAERAPFASPGHPGIDIGGDGRGCNTITGRFQVHHMASSGGSLTEFAATFEQHCDGGSPALRGCVSYGP